MSKSKNNRRIRVSRKRKYRKNNSRNKTTRGGEGYWERRATERRNRKAKPATMWSPWRYAKETGRMGENVKQSALEKLRRRQAALKIDNSNSEILNAAQSANAAFNRGFEDIRKKNYGKGVHTLTSATDQLEKDTNAKAEAATTEFNQRISGLDSKLSAANDMFSKSMPFGNLSEKDNAEVDEIMREVAEQVARENARRLPSAGTKRVSKR